MRQLDAFQSYFDNEGKFLIGRLRFCDTQSTPHNVYNKHGVTIGTSITTTASGRLSQEVFLGNLDYLIYVDKWVGEGPLDPTSVDDWQNIGSFSNLYNTLDIEVETEGVQCIANLTSLKALNPQTVATLGDRKYVCLLGYTTPGDKEPVYYYWDANVSSGENDGNVVKYTGSASGRWVMSINNQVDVRDFGAFPNASCVEDAIQRGRISVAAGVASTKYCSLYFGGNGCYDITNVGNLRNVTSSAGAHLIAKTNTSVTYVYLKDTSTTFSDDHNLNSLMCGNIRVIGDTLMASQDIGNSSNVDFRPKSKFIMDQQGWNQSVLFSFSNIDVSLTEVLKGPISFTNCNITSRQKLVAESGKALSFDSCVLDESMFGTSNDLQYCTFTNCTARNWDTIQFMIAVGGSVFDGQGKTISGSQTIPTGRYSNITWAGSVTANANTNQIFENCAFQSTITGEIMSLKNCTCSGNVAVTTLGMDGTNTSGARVTTTDCALNNCAIGGQLIVGSSIKATNVTCSTCTANSGNAVSVELANFKATNNNPNGFIISGSSSITGTCVNIVGGWGPGSNLDDSLIYRKPISFNDGLNTTKFRQSLILTSTLNIIQPSGYSGRSFVDASEMYVGQGWSLGQQIVLYNDRDSSEPVDLKLWSTVYNDYNIIGYIEILTGETIRLTYMGGNSYAVRWDGNQSYPHQTATYPYVNISNLLSIENSLTRLKVAVGGHT